MNNDQLFRQALSRQNDRASGIQMPADMEQRVMRCIKRKKGHRRWPLTVAIGTAAASVVLVLTLRQITHHEVEETAPAHVCYTKHEGRITTDPDEVMLDVANTMNDLFATNNVNDVKKQMINLFN